MTSIDNARLPWAVALALGALASMVPSASAIQPDASYINGGIYTVDGGSRAR